MTIDWGHFSPWSALIGGAIIGIAATLFILVNGRIAGISGIVGGLMRASVDDAKWRIAFIVGMLAAPLLWFLFAAAPKIVIDAGYPMLVVAGLAVGIGTRLGSGCTSGHGVCGLSRLSPRSLVATLAFMAAGFATVFVTRHLLGI